MKFFINFCKNDKSDIIMINSRYFKYMMFTYILLLLLVPTEYFSVNSVNKVISVQLIIEHGGIRKTHHVLVDRNSSLLDATLAVTEVEYRITSLGAFVDSIDSLPNDPDKSMYWLWWYWDWEANSWKLGPVASDKYQVKDGDILLWSYMETTAWPPETPRPLMSTLIIRVIEGDTGRPISDIEVKITSSTLTLISITNSTGWCVFQLPYGIYTFQVKNTEIEFTVKNEEAFLLVKV